MADEPNIETRDDEENGGSNTWLKKTLEQVNEKLSELEDRLKDLQPDLDQEQPQPVTVPVPPEPEEDPEPEPQILPVVEPEQSSRKRKFLDWLL